MNIQAIITMADHLVFTKTGKHLDDIQQEILKGTLEGQKYAQIAKTCDRSEGYIKDIGSDLWQNLSKILGENINKNNVKATFERLSFSLVSSKNIKSDSAQINNYIFCSNNPDSLSNTTSPKNETSQTTIDLGNAPAYFQCYGRIQELKTAHNLIFQNNVNLIAIYGILGIGKTTLALKIIQKNQKKFDYIIYQSLYFKPSLEYTLNRFLEILPNNQKLNSNIDFKISQLIKCLQQHKCLLVIDDVDNLFIPKNLSGTYQSQLENYRVLFEKVAKTSHNSCLIVCSREKPEEFSQWENNENHNKVYSMKLNGLGDDCINLLKDKKLTDQEHWKILIDRYKSHPLYVKEIAIFISEVFNGSVSRFVEQNKEYNL